MTQQDPSSGCLPKRFESVCKDIQTRPYVQYSIIHGGQDTEATAASFDSWIKVTWCMHAMEYCSAMRKVEILPLTTTWKDLENIMLSEIKSYGKSQEPYHLTHMSDIKLEATNEQARKKTSQTQKTSRWFPEKGVKRIKGKEGQINGDGRFDLGWRAHNAIHRWCTIELYTWNLYNLINQCRPSKINF